MDRSEDDRKPEQVREAIRLKRASIDNQLELLRLRRMRFVAYVAAAAVAAASLVAAVELLRDRAHHHSRRGHR